VEMMHGAGKAVGWQPLRHGVRLDEGAIDLLGLCRQNAVQSNCAGHLFLLRKALRRKGSPPTSFAPIPERSATTNLASTGSISSSGRATTTMKKAMTPMKKSKSAAAKAKESASPSRLIDARIKELGDWRGETLARVRALIKEACPDVIEEWKWR